MPEPLVRQNEPQNQPSFMKIFFHDPIRIQQKDIVHPRLTSAINHRNFPLSTIIKHQTRIKM
jgi:hypothetical protein